MCIYFVYTNNTVDSTIFFYLKHVNNNVFETVFSSAWEYTSSRTKYNGTHRTQFEGGCFYGHSSGTGRHSDEFRDEV